MIDENKNNLEKHDKQNSTLESNIEKDIKIRNLSGMYKNWFLDYASYVILERAVPNILDGLKPVQRRILHSMKELEDGRYNKVANIIGNTMKYHPHGDASIGDALVQLGQKDLLIDYQGNWGNILTGDSAAAPRYIEARLSKFALDVVFNPKTTQWKPSYDGRNKEPIALPVKFPLLIAQGVEGIAVGLSSKIMPHNFNEIVDASIAYLKDKPFKLYPDFITGGYIDVSKYNDGQRGGQIKIRAKIEKLNNRTVVITEIPYGKTTSTVIDSIIRANAKGKIKIKKIDDNTAQNSEIIIHLPPGVSPDKTIDALYAFTDCEVNISPNCCIIEDKKPYFLNISDLLKNSTNNTLNLLKSELQIQRGELLENLMFLSLEKIFIENRIYKEKEFEQSNSMSKAIVFVSKKLEPFKKLFVREITKDDILKLMDIKMARILKFNSDKSENNIQSLKDQIKEIDYHLENLVEYTINWFEFLKKKYGKDHPRLTEIRSFENIIATKVVEANEKLYINREEGFIGTNLKKDEFICNCSNLDDIIIFYKDGKMKVVKVQDKLFIGKNILYVNVFKKKDKRTIYNMVYRDGKGSTTYIKRFFVISMTRDKEYDLTKGNPSSRVLYFSANPNGEAEVIKVLFKPNVKIKKLQMEKDFKDIAIKNKFSMGNILSKKPIQRILLKKKGDSTLGGRKVWFDQAVLRLNYEERGVYLGEFQSNEQILVVRKNGTSFTTTFESSNHYPDDILIIEKYDEHKIWTAILYDADQKNYPYIKRFNFESSNKEYSFTGENKNSKLILLTKTPFPRFKVTFGGGDEFREEVIIDAEEFIGVKSFKAKGKRITTWNTKSIIEIEPTKKPDEENNDSNDINDSDSDFEVESEDVQGNLF